MPWVPGRSWSTSTEPLVRVMAEAETQQQADEVCDRLAKVVADVDCIYVIDDGKVAESGTGRELLDRGGLFAQMWNDYQTSVQWRVSKEA